MTARGLREYAKKRRQPLCIRKHSQSMVIHLRGPPHGETRGNLNRLDVGEPPPRITGYFSIDLDQTRLVTEGGLDSTRSTQLCGVKPRPSRFLPVLDVLFGLKVPGPCCNRNLSETRCETFRSRRAPPTVGSDKTCPADRTHRPLRNGQATKKSTPSGRNLSTQVSCNGHMLYVHTHATGREIA